MVIVQNGIADADIAVSLLRQASTLPDSFSEVPMAMVSDIQPYFMASLIYQKCFSKLMFAGIAANTILISGKTILCQLLLLACAPCPAGGQAHHPVEACLTSSHSHQKPVTSDSSAFSCSFVHH